MKTIGMIGGTGWVSTHEYYRLINKEIQKRLGGLNAARCILYSVNYADIDALNQKGDINGVYSLILDALYKVVSAGAECLILCANTTHRFADQLEKAVPVPIIHIVTATAKEINKSGIKKIGLLGTKQTMELDFYRNKLESEKISVVIPDQDDRDYIQNTINTELIKFKLLPESRQKFLAIINKLKTLGAEGIVLGCTEIPLLIKQLDVDIPVFNTLNIHALAAVEFALKYN
jgi:aspartate racemase